MTDFRTLDDFDPKGRRVLLRTDINVPVNRGEIGDVARIARSAETIRELADKGARVVVISHFGRPKGRDTENSLMQVKDALSRAVGRNVAFASDPVGPATFAATHALKDGEILLVENLRFDPREEKNDPDFAQELAKLGEIYVDDAFSTAHRAHASIEGVTHFLPSYAGRLVQAELGALGRALDHPERPVAALVGGAKISTKLDLLGNLIGKVDALIIGGAMANTFLLAQGCPVGKSLVEADMTDKALAILALGEAAKCQVLLPSDVVVAGAFKEHVPSRIVAASAVPADMMILDAGPQSVAEIKALLGRSRTLVWNGPLGAFEIPPFDQGTADVAREAARLTALGKLVTVAGGGDTGSALAKAGVTGQFSYVSTAGGAFLEWLEGKALPGIVALAPKAGDLQRRSAG
jgi:phosphoglycerate kinase